MKISNMIDAGGLIEDNDWTILDHAAVGDLTLDIPRVSQHQYGYIMFVNPGDLSDRMDDMIDFGFSGELVKIYAEAVLKDCILINFDIG